MEVHWSGWRMSVVSGEESADFVQILAARMAPAPDRSIVVKIFATSLAIIGSVVTYPVVVAVGLLTLSFLWIGKMESFRKNIASILGFGFLRSFFRAMSQESKPEEGEGKTQDESGNPKLTQDDGNNAGPGETDQKMTPLQDKSAEGQLIQDEANDLGDPKKSNDFQQRISAPTEPRNNSGQNPISQEQISAPSQKQERPVAHGKQKTLEQVKAELRKSLESIDNTIKGEVDKILDVNLTAEQLHSVAEFLERNEVKTFIKSQNGQCSLVKFSHAVIDNPSTFDLAFSWIQLASEGQTLGELRSIFIERQRIVQSKTVAGLTKSSADCVVPLNDELKRMLQAVINRETEILKKSKPENGNWLEASPTPGSTEEKMRNVFLEKLTEAHLAATVKMACFSILFFSTDGSPIISRNQILGVYVGFLRTLAGDLSNVFAMNNYADRIDFNEILNDVGMAMATEVKIMNFALTKTKFFKLAENAFATTQKIRTLETSHTRALTSQALRESMLEVCLPQIFPGISFCGAGAASTIFRVNFKNVGIRLIRYLLSNTEEADSMGKILLGQTYEAETRINPNFEGRTRAFHATGEQMSRLSGGVYSSPTFSAEILEDMDKKRKYVSMTSAGSKTLYQHRAQFITATEKRNLSPPPEKTIESAIWCQIFSLIVGQLDGHGKNFMVDADDIVRAIDPGLSFPPFNFGKTRDELLQNAIAAANSARQSEGTSSVVGQWASKKNVLSYVVIDLPPMTETMRNVLSEFSKPNGNERGYFITMLRMNNMTEKEIDAVKNRLDAIWRQLQAKKPFIIENTAELSSLWTKEGSPFTEENCLLRRQWK
ncbi:MAG: hypothetical protein LBS68_01925 [Puniceicoccales bacterium]|jgi:hypothetical protein|nr:hypothetical protein [Puniceicoccales bacterium]